MSLFPKAGEELNRLKRIEPLVHSQNTDTGRIYWYLNIAGIVCLIDSTTATKLIKSGVRRINEQNRFT